MFIGIDVGGTNIKYGLMDRNFNILFDGSITTGDKQDTVIDNIVNTISNLKNLAKEKYNTTIKGVGIGVPGVVNKGLDHVFSCPNLGWKELPLGDIIKKRSGLKTYLDNDANLAALAEFKIGSLKGVSTGVLLTLGTGVGGGLVVNGKMYRGGNGLGFEIGHTVIDSNFYNCGCGKNGCFETFASATAIVMHFKKLLAESGITPDFEVTSKTVFDKAKSGESLAQEAVDRYTKYLGIGIVNIINSLDPEVISLGGGVSGAGSFLLDRLEKEVSKNLLVKGFPTAKINYATAGNKAGIIGAALLARDEIEKSVRH